MPSPGLHKGFVLRVRYRSATWHLTLTDVQSGQQRHFGSLEELKQHLEHLALANPSNPSETPV